MPSELVAIPDDFDPVTRPLSFVLGDQDSLLDQKSVGQIQDLMAKKTDVPHEIRVCNKRARAVGALLPSNLPCRYMKARSKGSPFEATGAAIKTRTQGMMPRNRESTGLTSTFRKLCRLYWLRHILHFEVNV
jgi:hypothetical protein